MRGIRGLLLLGVALGLAGSPADAGAGKLKTLYTFTGLTDGGVPVAGLTYVKGALYGTAEFGGAIDTQTCPDGCGVAFAINPKTGAESVVHAFEGGASDGALPAAGLIYQAGMFYGTTQTGGPSTCTLPNACGTVFSLDPSTGAVNVLSGFSNGGQTGEGPLGGVVFQGGELYGTTVQGGNGDGNVFAVNAKTGAETNLLDFGGNSYGEFPYAGLTLVGDDLFGTTGGQSTNFGNVFELNIKSGGETILHGFTGPEGAHPLAGLISYNGALYGTTAAGGSQKDRGEVFEINPQSGAVTVLYSFTGGADGSTPEAGLVEVNGMLYGVTKAGGIGRCTGNMGCGTIFEVDPSTNQETTLYQFTGGKDQGNPVAALIYQGGSFYGTTAMNGQNSCYNQQGCGTVFKFTP